MLPNTRHSIFITGPAGKLESLVNLPKGQDPPKGAVVVCHPHPLKEGTMHNKVVHYLAKTFNNHGYASIRFNFRGVGQSEGHYGNGLGETEDALSVYDWTRAHLENQPIWLAGFSFGSYIALNCSSQRKAAGLITIAPAVNLLDFRSLSSPGAPWLMVHGDKDEVVPIHDAMDWYNHLALKPQLELMPDASHFFHGRLNDLRDKVNHFLLGKV